ncbi:MAG: hypothetical protein LUG98_03090, partial [Tannerellaceae bacterium]|nr:hypothetical protein [Tannerellaceae bacterium]
IKNPYTQQAGIINPLQPTYYLFPLLPLLARNSGSVPKILLFRHGFGDPRQHVIRASMWNIHRLWEHLSGTWIKKRGHSNKSERPQVYRWLIRLISQT